VQSLVRAVSDGWRDRVRAQERESARARERDRVRAQERESARASERERYCPSLSSVPSLCVL
jgi:hypothetical protein